MGNSDINKSSSYTHKSIPISKQGSAKLHKTCFQVMDVLIKSMPQGNR